MYAENADASARLRTRPATPVRYLKSARFRGAIPYLSSLVIVLGMALAGGLTWAAWNTSPAGIPPRTIDRLELIATVAAYEVQLAAGREAPTNEQISTINGRLPPLALADDRTVYVADWHGTVLGSTSSDYRKPRAMTDLLADEDIQPVDGSGAVGRTHLRDGTPVLVAIRNLTSGYVAVVQPRATMLHDHEYAQLRKAAPLLAFVTLAGLGAGCARYRRNVKRDRLRRLRTHRIETSLSHGRCGVWDWDTTRHRVFWSPSMYQLLGYEPRGEHMSAGEVVALLHPDDGGMRGLLTALAAEDACTLDRELRVRTAGGEWLWLRIKGETIQEPADGSRHLIGLAIDVTAERQAAERRARDEMRLHEAVEALSEAFVLWDSEERLIVSNSKFLALHGIAVDRVAPGTPAREIMAVARAPIDSRALTSMPLHSESSRRTEVQISDGRWFHVSERRTRDGGMVSVATDVSELKRKEARLRAREEALKDSVLAAETVAQTYALAAERNFEANQAKTEFMARVSHELRTPLNAIIGFSEVMSKQMLGPLDERYVGYTAAINASGVKLLEIIDSILQMSRIEKGQFDFAPDMLCLGEIVDQVITTVRGDVEAKGIAIASDIVGPAILQADEEAIRQILTQLVRNAVKFSLCDGRVRIRVRSAGGRINIFVEDEGVGIPREMLPELGRPFAQVEAEYSRSCGGAGLGLAIVQALIKLHDGKLTLRSQPGTGTIALVSLPKARPAANDAAHEQPHVEAPRLRLMAAE